MTTRDRTPFGERLHSARTEARLTQGALAKLVGMSQSALAELEKTANSSGKVQQLAEQTNVLVKWLATGEGPRHAPKPPPGYRVQEDQLEEGVRQVGLTARVPVVGTAKMGDDGYFEEISTVPGAGDGHVDIDTGDPNAYCLRGRGMSMYPAIRDGWYILILPNTSPTPGEFVLVKLNDGRKMVKEFLYQSNDSLHLMSVNGEERFFVEMSQVASVQAVGGILHPRMYKPD